MDDPNMWLANKCTADRQVSFEPSGWKEDVLSHCTGIGQLSEEWNLMRLSVAVNFILWFGWHWWNSGSSEGLSLRIPCVWKHYDVIKSIVMPFLTFYLMELMFRWRRSSKKKKRIACSQYHKSVICNRSWTSFRPLLVRRRKCVVCGG